MAFGRRQVAEPPAEPVTERDAGLVRDERALDDEVVEVRASRWDLGSVLATAAGVVLIVIGALALARTGIDRTWYDPVDQVLGNDHTALLGAIELGVGIVLVLAGLAGARALAGLVAVVVGAAATVAAIEPGSVERELAIEQEWAIAMAVGGFVLAAIIIVSRERTQAHRVERRRVTRPA
jgi:lysylphosphatidylglycerol synthetase-like protein (DUF2156 family)